MQTSLDNCLHKSAIVSANSLRVYEYELFIDPHLSAKAVTHFYAFRVHLVIMRFLCPVKTGVTLLADKQIREIYFFELKLDRLDELGGDQFCSLSA